MFINALLRQNPELISAARMLWQQGKIAPDSWVIDVDQLMHNGQQLLDVAKRHGISLYLMTKQIGRNPWLAEKLLKLGYEGLVVVDFKESRVLRRAGLPIAHQGHLVQIPIHQIDEVVKSGTGVITVFSLQKAREISASAVLNNFVQPIMLKIYAEQDLLYPGQEAGVPLASVDMVVEAIRAMPGIRLIGLTHFPCLTWDDVQQKICPTPNLFTLLAAREILSTHGTEIIHLNAPSISSCRTLPLLASYGVTHAEPGHALTGTLPSNQKGDQPEHIAMLYLTEISHHFKGKSYCFGGGYYRRGYVRQALVFPEKDKGGVSASVLPIDHDSIDYYLPLKGIFPVSSPVIMCFRTQVFVTRSDIALVSGIQTGKPVLEAVYDSLGNLVSRKENE